MSAGLRTGLLLVHGDPDETITTAAALGYDGVEIAINDVEQLDDASATRWKRRCVDEELYMGAHAPSMDLRLDSLNDGVRAESIRQVSACLSVLGPHVDYVTMHTGFVRKFSKLGALERVVLALAQLCDQARELAVVLCVENVFEAGVDELLDYLDLVGSDQLRITLDVAHAVVYGGFDPDVAISVLQDAVVNVHLSDNDGTSDQHWPVGTGVLPIEALVRRLDANGFDGYVTVEALTPEHAAVSLQRLRDMCQSAATPPRPPG